MKFAFFLKKKNIYIYRYVFNYIGEGTSRDMLVQVLIAPTNVYVRRIIQNWAF